VPHQQIHASDGAQLHGLGGTERAAQRPMPSAAR